MKMNNKNFGIYGKQILIKSDGSICKDSKSITETEIFKIIVGKFLDYLRSTDSELLKIFPEDIKNEEQLSIIISLIKRLSEYPWQNILKESNEFETYFKDRFLLSQFVENFYNYWREYERFFICYSDNEKKDPLHEKPYRTFNDTIETLNDLVRKLYRDVIENITNDHCRVYRQMPAGCQVGLIVTKQKIPYSGELYKKLENINFIRQVLIEPPLIIDPPMNTRSGIFKKVDSNPFANLEFNSDDWLCYPAKVGELIIYLYFHNSFIGLGTAVANLFDLADDSDLEKKPDAIFAYGVTVKSMNKYGSCKNVFFEDLKNDILTAAIPDSDEFGYFGYIKKMMLTLHNAIMMKRGRLPLHGAMVKISLKSGKNANIIIVGDTGAGKSETLEAFRVLGKKYIRDMTIIFDDMGSLEISSEGSIKAYGTETGAFVRLDDLQPGFAFGNIDRSIIMSPQKKNARAVIPVTTLKDILEGTSVDFLLYANNYEDVDKEHPYFEEFKSVDDALSVFRQGARMAKGTTDEKGLVTAYFANIFGPPSYKELHDELANKYFKAMAKSGVRIGQIRTRLGILGYEQIGPESAAEALIKEIAK